MKKLLFSSLFVMLALVTVQAAAPAAITKNAAFVDGVLAPLSGSATYYGHNDSLNGSDSIYLLKKFTPSIGCSYELSMQSFSGGATDSIAFYVYIDCYYGSSIVYRYKADSVVTAAAAIGQKVHLPLGETIFGTSYNVVLKTYTGHGGKLKVVNPCIFKRRIVDLIKTETINQ